MGSADDVYDNAMWAMSFFATLECELLARQRFPTAADARREVLGFIEGCYITRRIHSSLGYQAPANYEEDQPCRLRRDLRRRSDQLCLGLSHPPGRGQQNSYQTPSTTETNRP